MKNKIFYILITFALAGVIYAQAQDPVERGIDNYLKALGSKNTGLVESAIINIMKLKTAYPERDYSRIMEQLDRLSRSASSRAIRYESFVALNYLDHPERFNWIRMDDQQQFDEQLTSMVLKIHEQTEDVK
jgi:hypothetical protein